MQMTSLFDYIKRNYTALLVVLLVFSFAARVWRVDAPKGYIFDEVYHALTAKLISRGDPRAYEWWHGETIEPRTAVDWLHPPLAKLTQGLGMKIFGENEFGWRISSVIFGTLVVYMTATLAREIFKDETIALVSGVLFSLDGLGIAESRIAMNDVHVTFFILMALFFLVRFTRAAVDTQAWKNNLLLSGTGLGLALASKWSGFFVLVIFVSYTFFQWLKKRDLSIKHLPQFIFAWVVLPICIYLGAYSQMFLQGKGWEHFKELNNQIWWYQTTLEATHPYQSTPLQWVFNLRPVWIYVDYSKTGYISNIYAQGNTVLFWSGVVAVVTLLLLPVLHRRVITMEEKKGALVTRIELLHWQDEILLLLISYGLVWIPWSFSPRIMFFYHYLPAVPLLSILLSYCLVWLWKKGKGAGHVATLILALIILNFIIFYPNWTGLAVTKSFQETWYHLLPSWK